jgi:hypothetical protein
LTVEDAIKVRQLLDGEAIMGDRVRVYFGEPTRTDVVDQHLQAPKSAKLFFISPPPSPPHGWEMRDEEPPNKEVHAEDLATALSKLRARAEPLSPADEGQRHSRTRSSSTIVYDPQDHGHSPDLPAIAVEYLPDSPGALSADEMSIDKKFVHTARPPVELMSDA